MSFRDASTASLKLAPARTTTALPCKTSRTSSTSGSKSDGPSLLLLRRLTLPLVRLYKKSRVQTYFITMPQIASLSRFLSVALSHTLLTYFTLLHLHPLLSLSFSLRTHAHTYGVTSALYFPWKDPPISCDPTPYPSLETFGTTLPPARPCSLHPPFPTSQSWTPF